MINFQDLELPPSTLKVQQKEDKIRFIIGCDPFDNINIEKGYSVYSVYDKYRQKVTTTCKSKRTLENFAKRFIDKADEITKNYIISTKFVDEVGKAKRYSYATA